MPRTVLEQTKDIVYCTIFQL